MIALLGLLLTIFIIYIAVICFLHCLPILLAIVTLIVLPFVLLGNELSSTVFGAIILGTTITGGVLWFATWAIKSTKKDPVMYLCMIPVIAGGVSGGIEIIIRQAKVLESYRSQIFGWTILFSIVYVIILGLKYTKKESIDEYKG